jgi:hypothetical protein
MTHIFIRVLLRPLKCIAKFLTGPLSEVQFEKNGRKKGEGARSV